MPNWVKCVLTCECNDKRFAQIKEFVKSEDLVFDFNRIIPMPEDLMLNEGSSNSFYKDIYDKYVGNLVTPTFFNDPDIILSDEAKDKIVERVINNGDWDDIFNQMWYYTNEKVNEALDKDDPILQKRWILSSIHKGWQYYANRTMYGYETWYGWCSHNWNTKWNASDCKVDDEQKKFEFETAWAAPFPVIQTLSMIFLNVVFGLRFADEDIEGGNCGYYEYRDGEETVYRINDTIGFGREMWNYDKEEEDE